jgi:hypothetical protein
MNTQNFKLFIQENFNTSKIKFSTYARGTAFESNGTVVAASIKLGWDYILPSYLETKCIENNINTSSINDVYRFTLLID